MTRLQEKYLNDAVPALKEKFQYKNVMEVPKLVKVVINMGLGDCKDNTKPYAGIVELIEELRQQGMLTAVVSNKPDFGVQLLVEQHFPTSFDFAVGERTGIAKKPAPDSVNAVLAQLKIDRKDAVYIGDSEVDLATAKNADMDDIIVAWGFRDEDYLLEQGPTTLVHTVEELRKALV